MGAVVSQCLDLERVAIQTILGWLTPIDQDFGPFGIELTKATLEEESDDTHIDLKEFNLEGVVLRGKLTADLPMLGEQELPINLNLGLFKSFSNKDCEVDVRDFDFDENDDADEEVDEDQVQDRDFDFGSMLGAAAGGLMGGGGLQSAFQQVMNMDEIKGWVCEQVSDIINEQIRQRVKGGDDSDED